MEMRLRTYIGWVQTKEGIGVYGRSRNNEIRWLWWKLSKVNNKKVSSKAGKERSVRQIY